MAPILRHQQARILGLTYRTLLINSRGVRSNWLSLLKCTRFTEYSRRTAFSVVRVYEGMTCDLHDALSSSAHAHPTRRTSLYLEWARRRRRWPRRTSDRTLCMTYMWHRCSRFRIAALQILASGRRLTSGCNEKLYTYGCKTFGVRDIGVSCLPISGAG